MYSHAHVYIIYIYGGLIKIKVSGAVTVVDQPRINSDGGSLICKTLLRRESSKHCYISQYLEIWHEPGPFQVRLTIVHQSRTNRGFD